jgi:peptidyl-prolyl cis-trans isomerase A (cyclophilin A)
MRLWERMSGHAKRPLKAAVVLSCALIAGGSAASVFANTLVRVATSYGDFTIELFDEQTPQTVANFLGYVDRGDYSGSVFHRSVTEFVLQAGAYRWLGDCDFAERQPGVNCSAQRIAQQTPVVNEPGISNTRGTLAMAKLEGNPDSATSQWFINLTDNSEVLDTQNSGFTVFGRVLGEGLEVAESINDLPVTSAGGEAQQMPVRGSSALGLPLTENLVLINMHRVQRFSTSLHVFEYQTGLLSTQVNTNQYGRMSLLLKLVESETNVIFEVDPRSMVDLEVEPAGLASFSTNDQRLRIPQVEVNDNGTVSVLNNVVLRLADEARLRFVLESYE